MSRITPITAARKSLDTAAAALETAQAAAAELLPKLDAARAAAGELHAKVEAGDDSVTSLDLVSADAEVDRLGERYAGAVSRVEAAEEEVRLARIDLVTKEIASEFTSVDVPGEIEKAKADLVAALGRLREVLMGQFGLANELGEQLAAAGVPEREQINGVAYARTATPRKGALSYNVTVDSEPVAPGRYDGSEATRKTARVLEETLTYAVKANALAVDGGGSILLRLENQHERAVNPFLKKAA